MRNILLSLKFVYSLAAFISLAIALAKSNAYLITPTFFMQRIAGERLRSIPGCRCNFKHAENDVLRTCAEISLRLCTNTTGSIVGDLEKLIWFMPISYMFAKGLFLVGGLLKMAK